MEEEKKLKNPLPSVEQREVAEQEAPGVCPTVPKSPAPTHPHKHTTKKNYSFPNKTFYLYRAVEGDLPRCAKIYENEK